MKGGELLERDFVCVVGKGGVGRTTTTAALALAAARRGKRVLVTMPNTKERLGRMLGVGPIGERIRNVLPNVDAVNIEPSVALEEYGVMVLKVRALYRAIFENRLVAAFLRGTPGLDAWAVLGKTYFHATETDGTGRRRYDLVVMDGPATGHALDMLRVPRVLVDVAPPGLLRREAERAMSLFRDPRRSAFVLVTLPEDMPTNETIELHRALTDELGLPVSRVVANQVRPPIFHPSERSLVEALAADPRVHPPDPRAASLAPLVESGRRRSLRERQEAECLGRLDAALGLPRIDLPWLPTQPFGRRELESLSHAFDAA